MDTISVQDIVYCLEKHLTDKIWYVLDIVENGEDSFEVIFHGKDSIRKRIQLPPVFSSYDTIFNTIFHHFENVSIVKVHTTSSGDYFYIIVNHRACVTVKYSSNKGQKWMKCFFNRNN